MTPQSPINERLFIFHVGKAYPRVERWALRRRNSLLGRAVLGLTQVLETRRKPRSREYMVRLAKQVFPHVDFQRTPLVEADRPLPVADWSAIKEVALLWPDANGTGWAGIVRQVVRQKRPSARVVVLNGRGRLFELNRMEWRRLRGRHVLEQSLAIEVGLILAFVVITPWLTIWDLLHGRR